MRSLRLFVVEGSKVQSSECDHFGTHSDAPANRKQQGCTYEGGTVCLMKLETKGPPPRASAGKREQANLEARGHVCGYTGVAVEANGIVRFRLCLVAIMNEGGQQFGTVQLTLVLSR
jgi:hypothetical protein